MAVVFKIIIVIAGAAFWIFMGLYEGGRSLSEKDLSKKERMYLDILQIWFYVSLFGIMYCIINPE